MIDLTDLLTKLTSYVKLWHGSSTIAREYVSGNFVPQGVSLQPSETHAPANQDFRQGYLSLSIVLIGHHSISKTQRVIDLKDGSTIQLSRRTEEMWFNHFHSVFEIALASTWRKHALLSRALVLPLTITVGLRCV